MKTRLTRLALCPLFASIAMMGLVASPPARAQEQISQRYQAAQRAYQDGRYKEVVRLIGPLLYPKNRLKAANQLIEAHKMLGVSHVFEKARSAAEQSFIAILAERPNYELDPLIDPPSAVQLFEAVKQRNATMLKRIAERKQREDEERARVAREAKAAQSKPPIVVERLVEKPRYWLNFVPFGAGQFQNGHKTKGIVLLATQLTLGAASLGSALALRFAFPDSSPTNDQLNTARALNTTQVVTGALFWTAAVYGVIDAVWHFRAAGTNRAATRKERRGALSVTPSGISFRASF